MPSGKHTDRLKAEIKAHVKSASRQRSDEDNPADVYSDAMANVMSTIQSAYSLRVHGTIEGNDWDLLLNTADVAITKLLRKAEEEEAIDSSVKLRYAFPAEGSNILKAKTWLLDVHAFITIPRFLLGLDSPNANKERLDHVLEKLAPTPWTKLEQFRPSMASTVLARFTPNFDVQNLQDVLARLASSHPGLNVLPVLRPALFAHIDIQDDRIGNPMGIATVGDLVAVSQAGGWKDRDGFLSWYKVGADPRVSQFQSTMGLEQVGESQPSGFCAPTTYVTGYGNLLWAAGDTRIKAYDGATQTPLYTLNSRGYNGLFGVTDNLIFRASATGRVAVWHKEALVQHQPCICSPYDDVPEERPEAPFGGRLSQIEMDGQDEDSAVEVSAGQPPTSTFDIAKLLGHFQTLANIPRSSRWIYSLNQEEKQTNAGVRSFDLARPEAGVQIVGLGGPYAYKHLATHKDVPELYVAAGGDPLARIYDYRSPLPQILLDGHSAPLNCSAIAPYGGQFPLIFTGGSDELLKTWDIRYTKNCLYELSTGTLWINDMVWHEGSNSLWVAGENCNQDRLGNQHSYRSLSRVQKSSPIPGLLGKPERSDEDDDDDDYDYEGPSWPTKAHTWPNCFGKPWAASYHSVLQYRFVDGAPAEETPEYAQIYASDDGW